MEDTTTTVDSSQDVSSEETSQLEQAVDNSAEVATDEQTDGSDTASPEADEDLAWLRNKGLDPNDPEFARKAAQLARNTEREFHKSRTEAKKSQLQEEVVSTSTGDMGYTDPVIQRMMAIEAKDSVRDFYDAHPEARELDADMVKIVQAKPYLAQDLDTLYAVAKAGRYEADLKAAEDKGRTAAKQELSRTSGAAMPQGNASGAAPVKGLTRQDIAAMTADEYMARKDEINRLMAAGKIT